MTPQIDQGFTGTRPGLCTAATGSSMRERHASTNKRRHQNDPHAQGHTHRHRNGSPVVQRRGDAMTSADALRALQRLLAERSTARATGLNHNVVYMDDLESDLDAAREAFTGLAVTEIATLRGQLSGRQVG